MEKKNYTKGTLLSEIKVKYRRVIGFESTYIITIHGDLYRIKDDYIVRNKKFTYDKDGYLFTMLSNRQIKGHKKQHRLISECFIPNPKNKPQIDHINGIRDDNRIENLRWSTQVENKNNPITKEKYSKTRKGTHINIPDKCLLNLRRDCRKCIKIKDGVILNEYDSIKDASLDNNIHRNGISLVCAGKRKYAGGFEWKYKEV